LFAEKLEDQQGAQIVIENATVVHDTFSGHMDQTSIEKSLREPSIKDAIDDYRHEESEIVNTDGSVQGEGHDS
jgi:hypothetical protein